MPEKSPQQRGWRWKRTAVVAMLLLAGGAIVNVAVAWGCAVRPEPPPAAAWYEHHRAFNAHPTGHQQVLMEMAGMKVERAFGECRTVLADERMRSLVLPLQDLRDGGFLQHLPRKSAFHNLDIYLASIATQREYSRFAEVFTGWPMYTFRGVSRFQDTGYGQLQRVESYGIVSLPFNDVLPRKNWREDVPVHPVPCGFALNSLFYALLLWLVFCAPFTARRMLRRKRRLCEKCAYPVGVSPVCTECGAAVPTSVARSSRL